MKQISGETAHAKVVCGCKNLFKIIKKYKLANNYLKRSRQYNLEKKDNFY
jgi:hypothetical protein